MLQGGAVSCPRVPRRRAYFACAGFSEVWSGLDVPAAALTRDPWRDPCLVAPRASTDRPVRQPPRSPEHRVVQLGEASGCVWACRRLLLEHAMMDEPQYLRLAARLSEALDATERASREARRQRDAGRHRTSALRSSEKFAKEVVINSSFERCAQHPSVVSWWAKIH